MSDILLAFIAWGEENPICFTVIILFLIDSIGTAFAKFLKPLIQITINKQKVSDTKKNREEEKKTP